MWAFIASLTLAQGLRNEPSTTVENSAVFSHATFGKDITKNEVSKFGFTPNSDKYKFSLITVQRNRELEINDFFETSGIQDGTSVTARELYFAIDDLQRTQLVPKEYNFTHNIKGLEAEVSITKAHHAAIKEFLNSGADYALVFESDATLQRDQYPEPMETIESLIERAPKGWHEINLGRCASECYRQTFLMKISEGTNLVKAQNQYCSTAYILSKEGANRLDSIFSSETKYANYLMKSDAYDAKEYNQYSVEPRIFAHAKVPQVCNGAKCVNLAECGFTDLSAKGSCEFRAPCEASGSCYALDVADDQAFNYSFKGYSQEKLQNLNQVRDMLRGKHLRIRGLYKFLSGCGFFTYPLFVINQLEFAYRHGLVGDKAPIVYMPENHHYSNCHNDADEKSSDFWHKWFEPLKMANYRDVDESDVWEFTQDSIMTAYYDGSSVHAYPYPGDDNWECGEKWIAKQRDAASFIMKNFIHVRDFHLQTSVSLFKQKFGKVDGPVLGLHMRGTDKFVHPIVDPAYYMNATIEFQKTNPDSGVFLATDDSKYVEMFNEKFDGVETLDSKRGKANVLYDDGFPKDLKSLEVLQDSLFLAQSDELIKCWSGVSEFAVYFRTSEFGDKPYFDRVVDLESATEKRKRLTGKPHQSPSAPSDTCKIQALPDYSEGKAKEGETYCCPHLNSEFAVEREAAQLKIGKPKTGKGAFVILAQNKRHETYGRTGLDILNNTIRLLYKNYNDREKDDIIVLHEGDFDEETQKAVIAGRPEISFFHLQGENWAQHPADGIGDNDCCWAGVEGVGYRKMMRWYAIRVWPAMKAKGYKWVCRFDDDSYLLSPIPYNIFGFMEHYGYDYAYRNIARETGLIWDDPDGYPRLLRNYSTAYMNGKTGWMLDACEKKDSVEDLNRENCGDFYGFYNNFFVGHIDRFLEPDIQHFLKTIDDTGVIFTKRWNDLLLQSVTTQFFVDKAKTFHFTGWTYAHNSGFHDMLHYGIVQIGLFEEKPYKSYIRHMEEELKWNMAMHQKYLVNVNGLLTLATPNPAMCCANDAPEGWPNGDDVLTPTQMLC